MNIWTEKNIVQATCERGLAPYLAAELTAAGFPPLREHRTGVEISATGAECVKLCLQSRIAYSFLYQVLELEIDNADQLYRAAHNFAWEEILTPASEITLSCRVRNDSITDTRYPSLKLKDAIVDRLREKCGARPNSNGDKRGAVIQLNWQDRHAWIFLNFSGNKLSDRGYRKIPLSAPLRENLAAGILLAAGYDGSQVLVNPMCGSGTLAIEAALIARKFAPGLLRAHYGFQHFKNFAAENYSRVRRELAKNSISPIRQIIAGDIDSAAVAAAKKNAQTAGVDQHIQFHTGDFTQTPLPRAELANTLIILNPPYSERMPGTAELYKKIGDWLKQNGRGAVGCVFTGNREFAKNIGLKPERRIEFFNAKIECRLLRYSLY